MSDEKADVVPFKCLSIRQPWASYVVRGYKDIENRDWRTSYRGPLWIHAGKKVVGDVGRAKLTFNQITGELSPAMDNLPRGAIIGIVRLTDVLEPEENQFEEWGETYSYGFKLEDPERIEPIACKGKLNIFTPDARSVIEGVREAFGGLSGGTYREAYHG